MKRTYVLYHDNCFDGMGAAWAAWKRLGGEAEYRPVQYGQVFPGDLEAGATVYVLDFSWPRDILLTGAARHRIRVLDHHKTAQADLAHLDAPNILATFDLDKSGARLAWEYFHPGVPAPTLIRYVEDRDLWRWALPWSREVSCVTAIQPFTLEAYDAYAARLDRDFEAIVEQGKAVQAARNQMVESMAANATWRDIGGYRVPVANATILFSEVAEALCLKHPEAPFAAYYCDRKDGKRQWGLRSRGGFDVSSIARQYGGGGHAAAAGFVEVLEAQGRGDVDL